MSPNGSNGLHGRDAQVHCQRLPIGVARARQRHRASQHTRLERPRHREGRRRHQQRENYLPDPAPGRQRPAGRQTRAGQGASVRACERADTLFADPVPLPLCSQRRVQLVREGGGRGGGGALRASAMSAIAASRFARSVSANGTRISSCTPTRFDTCPAAPPRSQHPPRRRDAPAGTHLSGSGQEGRRRRASRFLSILCVSAEFLVPYDTRSVRGYSIHTLSRFRGAVAAAGQDLERLDGEQL